ncbi:MAG: hypothetical protein WD669_07705 [Pirellulales bacterium]
MIFPYRTIVSSAPGGSLIVFRRPEVLLTVVRASRSGNYLTLVDTGSDSTILPKSLAEYLQIELHEENAFPARAFGGAKVQLLSGDVTFRLAHHGREFVWNTTVGFFDFPDDDDEVVILGHAGFLDYFTATFDGKQGLLTLLPNDELPSVD